RSATALAWPSRSATTTLAPCAANWTATASPIPEAPPVTSATFPSNSLDMLPSLSVLFAPEGAKGAWPNEEDDRAVYHARVADVYVTINAPLGPMDRGSRFEDPLCDALEDKVRGFEVTGGGTLLGKSGVANCDIDLSFEGNAEEILPLVVTALEKLG